MREHTIEVGVLGPWSLATSRAFWDGFTPAALDAPRRPTESTPSSGWTPTGRAPSPTSPNTAHGRESASPATATSPPRPGRSVDSSPWTSTVEAGPTSRSTTR